MIFWFDYKSPRVGAHYDYRNKYPLFGELDLFFEKDNIVYNYQYCPFYIDKVHTVTNAINKKIEKNIGNKKIKIGPFEFLLKKQISYIIHEHGAMV